MRKFAAEVIERPQMISFSRCFFDVVLKVCVIAEASAFVGNFPSFCHLTEESRLQWMQL